MKRLLFVLAAAAALASCPEPKPVPVTEIQHFGFSKLCAVTRYDFLCQVAGAATCKELDFVYRHNRFVEFRCPRRSGRIRAERPSRRETSGYGWFDVANISILEKSGKRFSGFFTSRSNIFR